MKHISSELQQEPQGVRTPKKAALASWIGSAVEYYDFFIYGTAAALVFGKIFFPSFDPKVGTVAAFATFGVAYSASGVKDLLRRIADLEKPGLALPRDRPPDGVAGLPANRPHVLGSGVHGHHLRVNGPGKGGLSASARHVESQQSEETAGSDNETWDGRTSLHLHFPPQVFGPREIPPSGPTSYIGLG